jgi:hypothetical protein
MYQTARGGKVFLASGGTGLLGNWFAGGRWMISNKIGRQARI